MDSYFLKKPFLGANTTKSVCTIIQTKHFQRSNIFLSKNVFFMGKIVSKKSSGSVFLAMAILN